jgi:uncharacterized protein YdiU (UPF0061 family)
MLVVTKLDYTNFFRELSRYEKGSFQLASFSSSTDLDLWLKSYDSRLLSEDVTQDERHCRMLNVNPKFILRNYVAQLAIDDSSLVDKLFQVLTHPFNEWTEHEEWSGPAPIHLRNLSVSCSS